VTEVAVGCLGSFWLDLWAVPGLHMDHDDALGPLQKSSFDWFTPCDEYCMLSAFWLPILKPLKPRLCSPELTLGTPEADTTKHRHRNETLVPAYMLLLAGFELFHFCYPFHVRPFYVSWLT
jgi:hypothetical protein